MKISFVFTLVGGALLAGASQTQAQSANVDLCKPGPNVGELRAKGSGTNGGNYVWDNVSLQVGNYGLVLQPDGTYKNEFIAEQVKNGGPGNNPYSQTFSGLTPGKNYVLRVKVSFKWAGMGPPPPNGYTSSAEATQNFQHLEVDD